MPCCIGFQSQHCLSTQTWQLPCWHILLGHSIATGWIPTQNLVQMSRMMMLATTLGERAQRFIFYLCNEALQGEQGSPPPRIFSWSETDSVFSSVLRLRQARISKCRQGLLGLDSSTTSRRSTRLFFLYQGKRKWKGLKVFSNQNGSYNLLI